MSNYNSDFFVDQSEQSRISASYIIPFLLKHFTPSSVVDIGCGIGTWLAEFKKIGVNNILGIDGDYIDKKMLLIDTTEFISTDLNKDFSKLVQQKYDLAVSLEVAEHIKPESSHLFVKSLINISDIILFSAALPYQGGTAHINENWLEYWAILFRKYGYLPVDCIRPYIWGNAKICWWYKQNILVFAREDIAASIFKITPDISSLPLSYIHPEFFISAYWRKRIKGNKNITLDSQNYNILFDAYRDVHFSELPSGIKSYRDTFPVRFGGFFYKLRIFLRQFF